MRDGPWVVVWPDKLITGWNGGGAELEDLVGCPVVEIREALEAEHLTDAHMWPAWIEGAGGGRDDVIPRLNKKAREVVEKAGARILFGLVVVDVDDKATHRSGAGARKSWISEEMDKLAALPWIDTAGVYLTRGGYRLLWKLPEPLGIDAYLSLMAAFRGELAGRGIEADALTDWTRCYRLPRVVRDGRMEDRERDFSSLGVLGWRPPAGALGGPTRSGDQGTGRFAGIGAVKTTRLAYQTPERISVNRNMELTRTAGMMRRAGLTPDEILAALRVANEDRCDPPLSDDEVVHIAESSGAWEPGTGRRTTREAAPAPETIPPPAESAADGDVSGWARTPGRVVERASPPAMAGAAPRFLLGSDVHIAEHVLGEIETNGETLVFDRGSLWRYNDETGVWDVLPGHIVQLIVASFDGELITHGDKVRPFLAGAKNMRDILRVVETARSEPDWLDAEIPGLCFRNGFATVGDAGVELRPHSPRWRATCGLPLEYESGRRPGRFLGFLASCFLGDPDAPDKVAFLQEFVGACLLGRATTFQRGAILIGGGSNGKSTFQKVVRALFRGKTITAIPPQDLEQEYRRAMLAASRINMVSELPEADILESGPVKAAITGDEMIGRHIRDSPFNFHPRAGHLYSANTLPNVRDLTEGFFRRWLILEWNRRFEKGTEDPNLADRIVADELDGVAAWALEGAVRLERVGRYTEPESSRSAVQEWRRNADPVSAYLTSRCVWPVVEGTTPTTGATELYNDYARWTGLNGHLKVSSTKFGTRLRALGVETSRGKGGICYRVARHALAVIGGNRTENG